MFLQNVTDIVQSENVINDQINIYDTDKYSATPENNLQEPLESFSTVKTSYPSKIEGTSHFNSTETGVKNNSNLTLESTEFSPLDYRDPKIYAVTNSTNLLLKTNLGWRSINSTAFNLNSDKSKREHIIENEAVAFKGNNSLNYFPLESDFFGVEKNESNINVREVKDESMGKLKIDEATRIKIFYDYFTTVNKTVETNFERSKEDVVNENFNETFIESNFSRAESGYEISNTVRTFSNTSLSLPDAPSTDTNSQRLPQSTEGMLFS